MYTYTFTTKTPSAQIEITSVLTAIHSDDLFSYEQKQKFESICKNGCIHYNNKWACPPHSPRYSDYSKEYHQALLVLLYCNLSQFNYIKTEYMKIRVSNRILKSRMNYFLRIIEKEFNAKMISNGHCILCKPCSCKTKTGPCKKPEKRRYSMESLGLDVERICKDFFNHQLLWYKNGVSPSYLSAAACLLTNEKIPEDELITILKRMDTV